MQAVIKFIYYIVIVIDYIIENINIFLFLIIIQVKFILSAVALVIFEVIVQGQNDI
jgi:hypothetical protein